MFYTCDNCENQFSDNEPGVVFTENMAYCCKECAQDDATAQDFAKTVD